MSDRNMRNPRSDAGAAESRPDPMNNNLLGGEPENLLHEAVPGGEPDALLQKSLSGGGPDDLDTLLASLADDVPDMPADFHARWTSAVASEAGNCTQSGVPAGPQAEGIQAAASEAGSDAQGEAPARIWSEKAQMSVLHGAENDVSAGFQSDETQPAATAERKPAGKIRRLPAAWSRLIGVAAVMVFLVGGTLLTRDSFHAKMSQPVMASDAGGAVLQSARVEESAANLTEADSDGAEFVTTDAEQPADEAAYKEAALDSVLSGTAETTAEEPAMMLSMAPADEAAVDETDENEADIGDAEEAVAEDMEEEDASGSMADAGAGVPAAGLMMSVQADAPTAVPTAIPEAAAEPEADALSEEAVLPETDANRTGGTVCPVREPYRGDSLSGTAEAVAEESFDAAIGQEQAEQPAVASETGAYRGDSLSGTAEAVTEESFDAAMDQEQPAALSETARENEPEQIEPDRHPILTFLRDMGFFIRWIAPWALVLAVGVFAGWLVGRRR